MLQSMKIRILAGFITITLLVVIINTWTVQPKAGLNVGLYTAIITVTYDGGAAAAAKVSFKVNPTPEAAPSAKINYADETLTKLKNGNYVFNDISGTVTYGTYNINTSWFGSTVSIVKKGNGSTTTDSDPQNLNIPVRLNAPSPGKTDCTTIQNNNGSITNVTAAMEYSIDGTTWTTFTDTSLTGLASGTYYVRVKATTTAFNSENATITIGSHNTVKENTPTAEIDFVNETLTGLNGNYFINGSVTAISISEPYSINAGWFGSSVSIVKEGDGTATINSDAQNLNILARPAVPNPSKTDCTTIQNNNGSITNVTAAMEYSADGTDWTSCTGTTINNLTSGTYYVRVKATTGAFKSENATITIGSYSVAKENTPTAIIDFVNETLTGLNGNYFINGSAAAISITEPYSVNAGWFGNSVSIVKEGNGTTTINSDAQSLNIPARPGIPVIQGENETIDGASDGSITGVDNTMEYSADGTEWTDCTGENIAGLAPGTYYVRVKATVSAFRSLNAETVISTGAAQTRVLNVTAPTFEVADYGYTRPNAETLIIQNSGNSTANISSVTLTSGDITAFEIAGGVTTVAAGDSISTWTVQPKAGLDTGIYTANITVIYDDGKITAAEVSFIVNSLAPPKINNVTTDGSNNVTVNLNRPQQDNAVLIIAVYSGDKLLSVKWERITKSGEMTINDIAIPENADTIKAMMWNGIITIQPLCEPMAITKGSAEWQIS